MVASKRKAGAPNSNALTYWLDAIGRIGAQDANSNSFPPKGGDLILDAHRWGEAMVQAELTCLEAAGVPAAKRQNRFNDMAPHWYARGYRYWLAPHSEDAPEPIRGDRCPNKRVAAMALGALRPHAQNAGQAWWSKHASDLVCRVAHAVGAEASAKARRASSSSPAQRSPAANSSPRTVIAPKPSPPTGPELPQRLRQLITHPSVKAASCPRPSIREWVKNAFHDARIMRAWDDPPKAARKLSFLAMEAHTLELNLHACGLTVVHGDGGEKQGVDAMHAHGFGRICGGGFNTIWGCVRDHENARAAFPEEVWPAFVAGDLVLRTPRIKADWASLEEAVGEASNMLFCAISNCGPRIAALSFARKLFRDPHAKEEGVCVVKYKVFAFMERAKQSVDTRYAVDALASSSATTNRAYYDALLVAVYQYSHEGYVHLDATLRNFVDFYDKALPRAPTAWGVQVIDVEDKHFRRLCPQSTTEWRYLFLFNLMVVLVFLKVSLAGRWDAAMLWKRVRNTCSQLRSELDGKDTLAACAMWEGVLDMYEGFPDMALPPYAGDTHAAACYSGMRQLRYYLLEQPLEEAGKHYVDVVKDPKADNAALRKAREWHDGHYRQNVVPSHRFFLRSLAPPGGARRFVDVAFEFLDTSHASLQLTGLQHVPRSAAHNRNDSREYLLRIH
jgi:hypothetical protein